MLTCLLIFIQAFDELVAQPGTGTHFTPSYVNVTGGGALPDTTDGITCDCDGTGTTDVTSCLQAALDSANSLGKPLLIPHTDDYYKISDRLWVNCSVMGIGGMPTIKQTSDVSQALLLVDDMTGWIYNLHITGTYNGTPYPMQNKEYAHNIALRGVNGVTISNNLLETPQGDNIGDDGGANNAVRNVIITNNTLLDPWRCNISASGVVDRCAIMNNVLTYYSQYVNPIDLEPYQPSSWVTNFEIGYNDIQSPNPALADANHFYEEVVKVTAWFDQTPGGNVISHHNYGTWGVPFIHVTGYQGGTSTWTNILTLNNAEGDTIPGSDNQAPAVPAGLAASAVAKSSFTLSWNASSDNVGITGYLVYRGDTILGTTAATSFHVSGLTCGKVYPMTVKAYDAAGNVSEASLVYKIATADCGGGGANMLVNPGFESLLATGWTEDWGASAIDSVDVRSGKYAMKTGPDEGGRAQLLAGFIPGNTYTVSAWCRVTGFDTLSSYIGANTKDAEGQRISRFVSPIITDSLEWAQYSVTFTIPDNTSTLEIFVYHDGAATSVLTDDWAVVSLVQVTGVTITPDAATIRVGIVKQLVAAVEPANATNQEIRWSSSDTSIARVSPAGMVKGMKQGTATITVTTLDGDITATCAVTIAPPSGNMLVNPGIEKPLSTGWTDDWDNNKVVTDASHSGNSSLGVGPGAGGRAQPVTSLIPGSTYTLSAWCKITGSGFDDQEAYIGADMRDASGKRISTPSSLVTDSMDWQQVVVTFTVPMEARAAVVFVYQEINNNSPAGVLTDDWALISGWTPLPFEIPTSVNTLNSLNAIRLYPNPVKDQLLHMEGTEGCERIFIFDLTGRMVFSQKLEDARNQVINLNNKVQQGSYLVKITGRAGTSSQLLLVE